MPHARNVEGPTYSYSGGGSAKGGGTEPEERGAAAASGISLHVAPGHLFAGAAGTTRTEKMPSDGAGFVLSVEGCPSVRLLLVFCCVELENAFVFRFGDSVNAADALSESTDSLCLLMAVRMLMILCTSWGTRPRTPSHMRIAVAGARHGPRPDLVLDITRHAHRFDSTTYYGTRETSESIQLQDLLLHLAHIIFLPTSMTSVYQFAIAKMQENHEKKTAKPRIMRTTVRYAHGYGL
jgi:hypothetical protein